MSRPGQKALNLQLPAELHASFSAICRAQGTTMTRAIADYMMHVQRTKKLVR